MRRVVLVLAVFVSLLVAPAGIALAGTPGSDRVFTLHHRRAEEALRLLRPLLSEDASVTLQPKLNTLTVRDSAEVLARCQEAIAAFDLPPRAVVLSVTLLKAGPIGGPSGGPVGSPEIRQVGDRLRKLFHFTSYVPLDTLTVQATEGNTVAYTIASDFRITFLLEPSGDPAVVRLKDLALDRIRRDERGRETRGEILHTNVTIPLGQTNVLGVGRDEAATGALFLVFSASPKFGPGIAGMR